MRVRRCAFTLLELLVVLAIIGLILALSLPNFRHMNEGRTMEGAVRQLLDDLALARQTAIANRGTVALVFVPPAVQAINATSATYDGQERTNLLSLQGGALTTYALFSYRRAGDQPGRNSAHYVTTWRTLPEKVFISQAMFTNVPPFGFQYRPFPFPLARSATQPLPYIAFNAQGECLPVSSPDGITDPNQAADISIPLATGSILYGRDPATGVVIGWTVQEIPQNNPINTSNIIHIDWLTGRAKLERADVTKQ